MILHPYNKGTYMKYKTPSCLLKILAGLALLTGISASESHAAKLIKCSILDQDYLAVNISDGDVIHLDEKNKTEQVLRYTPELNTGVAVMPSSWSITSVDDANYSASGKNPVTCARKKKLNGHAEMEWSGNDYRYEYTYEHWIYLQLPFPLKQGNTYSLQIVTNVNTDTQNVTFTFDKFNSISEAIHINLTGYSPDAPHKGADLYYWMGSGGPRNYSAFEGNPVYLYNVDTGAHEQVGVVEFWKKKGSDVHGYDLTGSDVWKIDFSGASAPGTYRLVVDGVGCSQDFTINDYVYHDPFKVSLLGYFYMRAGETNPKGISPPPRTPLYIPGVSPASTKVYLTTMHPFHPEWETFTDGDKWDAPDAWKPYVKSGSPANPNAYGGHADAADWDRHLGHVINIYDMLLPYLMSNGAIDDDDLGITESGNGIPDIIDEVRYEVDFWLRLRDGSGYSHGLTNPNDENELFQAAPTALAAWANAANAAMLADAFRVAGLTSLKDYYRDAAIEAYNHASGLADQMLDELLYFDEGHLRGRDLRMMAAAFLYNVTGITSYEKVINSESVCASGVTSPIQYFYSGDDGINQLYATAAYLITPQPVHYSTLYNNMKSRIISEAKSTEADLMNTRPSRRTTYNPPSYWRTAHFVGRTIVAHAITESPIDKNYFQKALDLEAGWGLGRNPLNMIEMSTATTSLETKRSITEVYTSGRDDGIKGVDPGHTPYMNLTDWWQGMTMAMPSKLYENSYPGNVVNTWPIGETYFPSRWVFSHTEYTPRQTMKGKVALYGYLYSLAKRPAPVNPVLTVSVEKVSSAGGNVTSSPAGIECGSDCTESYANGSSITLTAVAEPGSTFIGWNGPCSGTGTCEISMVSDRSVSAIFRSNTVSKIIIYDDTLGINWQNWSWSGTFNLSATTPVHSGNNSINITLDAWGGFSPALSTESDPIDSAEYEKISFWVNGGTKDRKIDFFTEDEEGQNSSTAVINAKAGIWTQVDISMDQLGNPSTIKRLNFFNNSGSNLSMFTLDDISMVPVPDDNPGWRLISMNREPVDTTIANVIEPFAERVLSVWTYDMGKWKVYDALYPALSDLTTMVPDKGYWINMADGSHISFSGAAYYDAIKLSKGWNLAGYNSLLSMNISDAISSIADRIISIWAYDNEEWKVYYPGNPASSNLETMSPGNGYWINVTGECTWTLP